MCSHNYYMASRCFMWMLTFFGYFLEISNPPCGFVLVWGKTEKSLKKLAVIGNQIHGPRLVCQVTPISLSRGLFRTCTCEVLLLFVTRSSCIHFLAIPFSQLQPRCVHKAHCLTLCMLAIVKWNLLTVDQHYLCVVIHCLTLALHVGHCEVKFYLCAV